MVAPAERSDDAPSTLVDGLASPAREAGHPQDGGDPSGPHGPEHQVREDGAVKVLDFGLVKACSRRRRMSPISTHDNCRAIV